MTVAEAWRAAELVVDVDTEVTRFASVALLALDVALASADARHVVARRLVAVAASLGATTRLAALTDEHQNHVM